MRVIVTEYQWTPGYKWERFQSVETLRSVRTEFGVDPRKVATIVETLPCQMGERIIVFAVPA